MYEKFLNYFTDYIFVKDEPQKADVIFVPGNGYPQMAVHAAELWKEGFAPYVLPSGRYSTVLGHFAGVQDLAEQYGGHRGKKSDPLLPESPCETVYSVLPACLPGDRVFCLSFGY